MANTKITNAKELIGTKYLSLYQLDVVNKAGQDKSWMVASRKSMDEINDIYMNNKEQDIDAVVIVPIHKETGKLVLVNQFRVPINGYILELPAGLIDNKEDFEVAVKRELKEETGLDLLKIDKDLTRNKVYMSPGMTDESIALVYCLCSGELSTEHLEVDEEIEPIMVSKEEAKEILKSEALRIDVKAYLVMKDYVNGLIDLK